MKILNNITTQFHVMLSDEKLQQFEAYYNMLIEWNKVMNLTAITEKKDVILKHFADSLLIAKYKRPEKDAYVMDVGTGAGFPGIPLKIAFPEIRLTLMESLNKRVKFLSEVLIELGLENVEVIQGRAEDFGRDERYREQYDMVVSRAVANMSSLSEYCIPFVKPGGYFIPYKAVGLDEEMKTGKKAVRILGGQIENIFRTSIPDTDMERCFVFVRKVEKTPDGYPRKVGMATKKPLGKNI